MKKIIAFILLLGLFSQTAYAYNFPQPDWGSLLNKRKAMVNEKEFGLYVEGSLDSAPYYGAKLEPRAGAYIGTTAEEHSSFAPLSSHLTYMEYEWGQSDLYYPSNDIVRNQDTIPMIGFTASTVSNVDYNAIRNALNTLNGYNKPMFIRFANEMNCSSLGKEPSQYIEAFRTVANMVHEYPNFAVVWSPNDMGALDRPFDYYYPGDEYVDWVGVSCYMTKYFQNDKNTSEKDSIYFMTGDYAWATNKIKPFMEFLSANNIQKPVMISEGAAARKNQFGDDYSEWNESRMRNMLWYLVMKYPQIKMINYFNKDHQNDGEKYNFSSYPTSVDIFKEAAASGAYKRYHSQDPSFVFSPANNGETLIAKNGIVNLYTYAYFPKNPNISVNYRIDGEWFHSSDQIPYICKFDINSISDGEHTLTIDSAGESRSYTLYKRGQLMSFGREPDTSYAAGAAAQEQTSQTGFSIDSILSSVSNGDIYDINSLLSAIIPQASPSYQNADVTVIVNGKRLSFEQAPVIVDNRTLVPMRDIFEAMGATVLWSDSTKTATAVRGADQMSMTIGSNIITKNGIMQMTDVPPQIINGRTMIPARAAAEGFGADVMWDGNSRTIAING